MTQALRKSKTKHKFLHDSLEGDGPKYEIVCDETDASSGSNNNLHPEPLSYVRARVLCSYDAKDNSELNLVANEVCFRRKLWFAFWN